MSDPASTDRRQRWLTAEEAGEYLCFSSAMIRQLCRRKLLTHSKMPGRNSGYRFRVEWLDEFAEARVVRSTIAVKPSKVSARPGKKAAITESVQETLRKIRQSLKQ